MKTLCTIGKKTGWIMILAICVCIGAAFCLSARADTLTLPSGLKTIEAEAFNGDTSLDQVVLPNGLESIGSKAFAGSSLRKINLPDSVTFIAEDAFDGPNKVTITVNVGETYVYQWAVGHGYIDPNALRVEVTASAQSAVPEDTVTWTAQGFNGVEPYKFRFRLYRAGALVASKAYSSVSTFSYTFAEEGSYVMTVSLKDDDGATAEFTCEPVEVTLEELKIVSVTCDRDAIQTTETAVWTAAATGGQKDYSYKFVLKKGSKTLTTQNYSEQDTFSYTFETAASYTLNVYVRDAKGTVASQSVPVTVTLRPVEITGITGSVTSLQTENEITWTVTAFAGKEPYTYSYEVLLDGVSVSTETGSALNTFSFTPETAGSLTLNVTVTDAAGNTAAAASDPVTVTTLPLRIVGVTAAEDWVQNGGNITWTVEAVGGVKPLRYAFDVFIDGEEQDGRAFNEDNTYVYLTEFSGVYTVKTRVRDAVNTTVSLEQAGEVNVYDPVTVKSITADASSAYSGEKVVWTADVTGGKGTLTYVWYIYNGSTLEFTQQTDSPTFAYAPTMSGTYKAKAVVEDETGASSSKTGGTVTVTAHAATSQDDFSFSAIDGSFFTLEKYNGSDTAVVVPYEWTDENGITRRLRTIANEAFRDNTAVVSVVLPDGGNSWSITMGDSVFAGCTNLLYFKGGRELTNIGYNCFGGCTGLVSVDLPETLTKIDYHAFANCTALESIHLPDSVTTMYMEVFAGCSKLQSVNYPTSWTTKGGLSSGWSSSGYEFHSPFYNCPKLTSIVIPEGVTSIPDYAFYECSSLIGINIPRSVASIGSSAFYNCSSLTIYGVENSFAHTFASDNNIPFSPVLDDAVSSWSVGAEGAETTLRIRTDGYWSIASVPEWVSLSAAYGTNRVILTVTVSANTGAARDGRLLIKEGIVTNTLLISQAGTTAGLSVPQFLFPAENAAVDFGDVTFQWTAEGAASSVLSLRDLTTNLLITSHENMGSRTSFTMPASTFIAGHQYRVAVGVSEEENPYASDVKKWKELLFSVSEDEEHSTTLSGNVVSLNNNPLAGVLVTVKADGRIMASATTDTSGAWSLENMYRGGEYTLMFSKPGYVFSEDKTVTASGAATVVDTLASDSAYDDEIIVLSANTDTLQFGSERNSAELRIISNADWTVGTDADWLTVSTDHGSGNGWIVVTAEANTDADPGSEDRSAVITIEEIPTAKRAERLRANGADPKNASVSARQNSPVGTRSGENPFEGNKYTGAPVTGPYDFFGDLTINKAMDLTGGSLSVSGDVTIKAPVDLGTSGRLEVSGKLTVCGNGILDMSSGGTVVVQGDFIFDPSKTHEGFLKAGEIKVGGNVTIKQKFYAGPGHRFTVMNNGKKHTINMWDKWVQKDQYFGIFVAEPSIGKLEIKESFTAAESIWNYQDLTRYHTGYLFELTPFAGGTLSFGNDINSRIQSGMMRLIGQYGKAKNYLGMKFIDCQAEEYFAYLASDGTVKYYYLELDMHEYVISSLGFGTGYYSDDEGHGYKFTITNAYAEMDTVMRDFNNWKNDLIKGAIKDEIRGYAVDAATSMILAKLPLGASTKEITKSLKDNAKELANLYSTLTE